MKRRMEDRIRQLCSDVVSETDEERVRQLSEELRVLLRRHAAALRSRISNYSFVGSQRFVQHPPALDDDPH